MQTNATQEEQLPTSEIESYFTLECKETIPCPFNGCYFKCNTDLELVDHLYRFHTPKQLARLSAWFAKKYRSARKFD